MTHNFRNLAFWRELLYRSLACDFCFKLAYRPSLPPSRSLCASFNFPSLELVESTHRLCTLLNYFDDLQVKIKEYSGRHRQSVRSKTLDGFRKGDIQVFVCSDAMTRGMDVEGVKIVINYDIPVFIKTYIHRAGRAARAARSGKCFTLLCKNEVKRFKKLLQKAEHNCCAEHILPPNSIDSLRPIYKSALDKLKETVDFEASTNEEEA